MRYIMPILLGELKLYALKELSKSLGITTFTLRTYIRQGKLRARKMGTKWLVTEDALKEYFKEPQESKREDRISLHGIISNSKVTKKDIEEAKGIMEVTLDTHTFIWYLDKSLNNKLSQKALRLYGETK